MTKDTTTRRPSLRHLPVGAFRRLGPPAGVLFLLAVFAAAPLAASSLPDPGTLAGQVTDSTGVAIEGVEVTVVQLNRRTVTDEIGRYRLTGLPAGRYAVSFQVLGYASQTHEVRILEGSTTTLDVLLGISAIQVAPVVVTATPLAADPRTTAPDVAVLAGREKLLKQQASLGGSLEHLPGVANIATGMQAGKPVIRGLSGNRIRVLNGGITMDYQQYGVRHWANVDPFLAERIELVRGASSVLYGSDALGGAVNVLPRSVPEAIDAPPLLRGGVLGEYSANNGELAGGLSFEGAIGGLGWTGSFVRRSAGNLRTPDAPTADETGVRTDPKFTGRLEHTDYDQLSGSIGVGYHSGLGLVNAHYIGWRDEHNFLLPSGGGIGQNLENDLIQARAVLAPSGDWLLRYVVNYVRNLRQSNPPGATRDALPDAIVTDIELMSYTGRLEAEHPTVGPLAGQAGVEYQYQDQDSRGLELLVPSAKIRTFAAFVYEEVRGDRLSLSVGGRFDRREQRAAPDARLRLPDYESGETNGVLEQSYGVFSGSIGAAYRVSESLTVAANVGRGFRSPSIFELHVYGVHGGVAAFQIGDANLKKEVSLNTDLSFRWRSPTLQASLTGYRNAIDSYIYLVNTEDFDSVTGLPIMRMTQGDAVLWGADGVVEVQVLPWLRLGGMFRAVFGNNVRTNQKLPLLPASAVEGRVTLTRRSHWDFRNLYLNLSVRHVTEKEAAGRYEPFWQYDDNASFGVASTDGYTLLNLGLGFELPMAGRHTSVDVVVRNVLDVMYRDFLDTYKGYALSPGRDVRIKMAVPFGHAGS